MVGVVFAAQLLEEVDEPFGFLRRLVEDRRAQTVDESERRERVTQPEVLRVAVGLLDAVGGVLAEAGVHPLRADEQFGSSDPVRHDDVDLFEVVLAENAGAGRCRPGRRGRSSQAPPQRFALFGRHLLQQAHHGRGQDARSSGAGPHGVGVEAGTTELVGEPDVQCEGGHACGGGRFEVERDAEQPLERVVVGLVDQAVIVVGEPGTAVFAGRGGIRDDAVEDGPRLGLGRWFSGHCVPVSFAGSPSLHELPAPVPVRRP